MRRNALLGAAACREGDLEIGLPSPGLDGGISSVNPGRRALESRLFGKRLDQSPSQALDSIGWNNRRGMLVMSRSSKRLDVPVAVPAKNPVLEVVRQVGDRHNDMETSLPLPPVIGSTTLHPQPSVIGSTARCRRPRVMCC